MPTKALLRGPGLLAFGAVVVCLGVYWADPTTPGGPIPVCPTKALLGFNCPGCGSSRMLYSLLHGDILAALHYNALGVLALILISWSFTTWTASILGYRLLRWEQWRYSSITVGIVILTWFILRILPWEPFIYLRV